MGWSNLCAKTTFPASVPGCVSLAVDKSSKMDTIQDAQAEVAELADALGSGLSSRKGVRVQVPPSALWKTRRNAGLLFGCHMVK